MVTDGAPLAWRCEFDERGALRIECCAALVARATPNHRPRFAIPLVFESG